MISPLRLKANRTDICMPARASSRPGGTQHARSASNMACSVSSLRSSLAPASTPALAGRSPAAALSMVNRRSCPTQYSP